ncbi:MAG: efflux RND transporter periplasmic adaptor subunit [Lysobacter sp.]|nr:efflux RND transporter periplasmic adaptor subunit [Lysobacter sp.]
MLMVVVLAACGNAEPTSRAPRPVLVARADTAGPSSEGLTAFAGEIRAREETALSFRVGGKLARRLVDAGDQVHKGDVLAELDPGDLQLQADASQAQLAAAEAQLARSRADHARFAALSKDQLVSRSSLDQQTAALRAAEGQVRAARAQRDVARNQSGYASLLASADGVIAARMAEAGQVLAPGQTVFSFAVEGGREVAFALPESSVRGFQAGQMVLVELWNTKGPPLSARIREISPVADPSTRTYAARASLAPEHIDAVALGQSARVYIVGAGQPAGLTVPLSAVQRDAEGLTMVWVADPESQRARPVRVVAGSYSANSVPILSGLKPTDWIVVAGGHLLHADQAVLPVDRSNRPVQSN